MSSGEEIDYSKFIGKNIPPEKTEEEMQRSAEYLAKMRQQREKEDAEAAKRYKDRKETLRHKYSPIRRTLSKQETDEFTRKTT